MNGSNQSKKADLATRRDLTVKENNVMNNI